MSQIKALLSAKHTCTIMCKPGSFAESLKSSGVSVLETDYVEIERSIEQAMSAGPFDLVHAHPSLLNLLWRTRARFRQPSRILAWAKKIPITSL